jgi:hypothetical protein
MCKLAFVESQMQDLMGSVLDSDRYKVYAKGSLDTKVDETSKRFSVQNTDYKFEINSGDLFVDKESGKDFAYKLQSIGDTYTAGLESNVKVIPAPALDVYRTLDYVLGVAGNTTFNGTSVGFRATKLTTTTTTADYKRVHHSETRLLKSWQVGGVTKVGIAKDAPVTGSNDVTGEWWCESATFEVGTMWSSGSYVSGDIHWHLVEGAKDTINLHVMSGDNKMYYHINSGQFYFTDSFYQDMTYTWMDESTRQLYIGLTNGTTEYLHASLQYIPASTTKNYKSNRALVPADENKKLDDVMGVPVVRMGLVEEDLIDEYYVVDHVAKLYNEVDNKETYYYIDAMASSSKVIACKSGTPAKYKECTEVKKGDAYALATTDFKNITTSDIREVASVPDVVRFSGNSRYYQPSTTIYSWLDIGKQLVISKDAPTLASDGVVTERNNSVSTDAYFCTNPSFNTGYLASNTIGAAQTNRARTWYKQSELPLNLQPGRYNSAVNSTALYVECAYPVYSFPDASATPGTKIYHTGEVVEMWKFDGKLLELVDKTQVYGSRTPYTSTGLVNSWNDGWLGLTSKYVADSKYPITSYAHTVNSTVYQYNEDDVYKYVNDGYFYPIQHEVGCENEKWSSLYDWSLSYPRKKTVVTDKIEYNVNQIQGGVCALKPGDAIGIQVDLSVGEVQLGKELSFRLYLEQNSNLFSS